MSKAEPVRGAAAALPFYCSMKRQRDPLTVSVIIPTYNRATLVVRAVESALNQTEPPLEIIVIDDGSTDGTGAALRPYADRIAYIRQQNQGVTAARNTGIAAAKGSLIAFLDSDDVWMPWKLALQRTCFERHSELVLLGTGCTSLDDAGRLGTSDFLADYGGNRHLLRTNIDIFESEEIVSVWDPTNDCRREVSVRLGDLSSAMFMGNLFVTSTIILRASVLPQIGFFDREMKDAGEDYDFFWRITEFGRSGIACDAAILFRRGGTDQLHGARRQMALSNLAAIQKYLSRHPYGPRLPKPLVARRMVESYEWLGITHFDDSYRRAARRYLFEAVRLGSRSVRVHLYLLLSFLPKLASDVLKMSWDSFKRARSLYHRPSCVGR